MFIKKILPFYLLIACSSCHAEKDLYSLIGTYKTAFIELEKYLSDIQVTSWVTHHYDSSGMQTVTHYDYQCYSEEAKTNLAHYQTTADFLSNKILVNALGDGFLLGILIACCNKMLKGETFNKKVILPTIACAIAMIFYQNNKLGTVPYFDARLNKHDSQFENVSFYSLGRIVSALVAASISYLGTDYAITKLANAVHDIQAN